jgi:hypothetical protein
LLPVAESAGVGLSLTATFRKLRRVWATRSKLLQRPTSLATMARELVGAEGSGRAVELDACSVAMRLPPGRRRRVNGERTQSRRRFAAAAATSMRDECAAVSQQPSTRPRCLSGRCATWVAAATVGACAAPAPSRLLKVPLGTSSPKICADFAVRLACPAADPASRLPRRDRVTRCLVVASLCRVRQVSRAFCATSSLTSWCAAGVGDCVAMYRYTGKCREQRSLDRICTEFSLALSEGRPIFDRRLAGYGTRPTERQMAKESTPALERPIDGHRDLSGTVDLPPLPEAAAHTLARERVKHFSRAESLRALVEAGICNDDQSLTERYR